MRRGIFGVLPSLAKCHATPSLSEAWGVESNSLRSVGGQMVEVPCGSVDYQGVRYLLYRHPMLLIPQTVMAWWKDYEYSGDNYSVVPYIERHPCWLEMRDTYEGAMRGRHKQNDKHSNQGRR